MSELIPGQGRFVLGKAVAYAERYAPELLCVLSRGEGRKAIGLTDEPLPFDGADFWTGYELSWLDRQGKPGVAIALFEFPCHAPGMIESKSFKLYLNSFNQSCFDSAMAVQQLLARNLSAAIGSQVGVQLFPLIAVGQFPGSLVPQTQVWPGQCLDDLSVVIDQYTVNPTLLEVEATSVVGEAVHSHLLKSNCPVTGQPDWASVLIRYSGPHIKPASLLKYICSYRQQQEFHEQCIERMFCDLLRYAHCQQLTIEARYVRRGGLDINPFRSNCGEKPLGWRLLRQ